MTQDPNDVLKDEVIAELKVIADEYGKSQCLTVASVILKELKRIYAVYPDPEAIVAIKKSLIKLISRIDWEPGKKVV